jgi:hypothetical protein
MNGAGSRAKRALGAQKLLSDAGQMMRESNSHNPPIAISVCPNADRCARLTALPIVDGAAAVAKHM